MHTCCSFMWLYARTYPQNWKLVWICENWKMINNQRCYILLHTIWIPLSGIRLAGFYLWFAVFVVHFAYYRELFFFLFFENEVHRICIGSSSVCVCVYVCCGRRILLVSCSMLHACNYAYFQMLFTLVICCRFSKNIKRINALLCTHFIPTN